MHFAMKTSIKFIENNSDIKVYATFIILAKCPDSVITTKIFVWFEGQLVLSI